MVWYVLVCYELVDVGCVLACVCLCVLPVWLIECVIDWLSGCVTVCASERLSGSV